MHLEITTLLTAVAISYGVSYMAIVLAHVLYGSKKLTVWWVLGGLSAFAGSVLVAGRATFGLTLSVIVANTLLAASFMFVLNGVRLFIGREKLHPALFLLLAPIPPFLYWFTFFEPNLAARLLLMHVYFMLFSFVIGYELLQGRNPALERVRGLAGWLFTAFGLFFLCSGIGVYLLAPDTAFHSSGISGRILIIGSLVFSISYMAVVVMMLGERTQMELYHAREEAEQANRAKSAFLANMSHDIRTPLNTMLGMTELSLQGKLPDEQRTNLTLALDAGKHLLSIVDDILDITAIESDAVSIHSEDFDLAALLLSVRAAFAKTAADKSLQLHVESPPDDLRHFRGDADKLRQVLFNLTSNALKFTETGDVRISIASLAKHGPSQESLPPGHKGFLLSVADTGPGIPAAERKTIFDRFTRSRHSRHVPGTGLGLAICSRLVKLMGGRIWVEDNPGGGAVFRVVLFLSTVEAGRAVPDAASSPRHAAERRRILIVDDDPMNILVIGKQLHSLGHEYEKASDGHEALALLRRTSCDLVFVDVDMPGMDGYEFTRRVRSGEAGSANTSLPIVALTGHAFDEHRDRARESGMDDFLSKPAPREKLRDAIQRLTGC